MLFAVLHAVGAGIGFSREEQPDQGAVKTWGGRLEKIAGSLLSKPLEPKDLKVKTNRNLCRLEQGNRSNFFIILNTAGQTCEARIERAKARVRKFSLVAPANSSVKIKFLPSPAAKSDEPRPVRTDVTLKPRKVVEISAFTEGGTLWLTCIAGAGSSRPCKVGLEL